MAIDFSILTDIINNFLIVLYENLGIIIALTTIIVIVYIEIKRDQKNKKALFNSLFDELRHNINMSDIFVIEPSNIFIKKMCYKLNRLYGKKSNNFIKKILKKIINKLKNISSKKSKSSIEDWSHEFERIFGKFNNTKEKIYPYPSEDLTLPPNSKEGKLFFKYFIPNTLIKQKLGTIFIEYQTSAIENALSSGIVWNLIGKRPAKNLGHLYYSLRRLDIHKKRYAEKKLPENWHNEWCKALGLNKNVPFHQLIYEYWMWVHFRVWFLYLDLALSSPKKLIDHDDLENIKEKIDKQEWKKLRKSLRKTLNR